jgi:hypothetical protein
MRCGGAEYVQSRRRVSSLVLYNRARLFVHDTQPPHVRQHVGSAAWFGLSRIEEGSAYIPWVLVPLVAQLAHFAKLAFLG